jgi:hypothetical protein
MPTLAPHELIIACQEFVLKAYKEDDLTILLFKAFKGYDYHAKKVGDSYEVRVFHLVKSFYTKDGEVGLYQLTRVVVDNRKDRDDIKQLRDALEAALPPGDVAPPPVAGAVPPAVPPELVTVFLLHEQQSGASLSNNLVEDIRDILRSAALDVFDLPDQFHLSELARDRLAAVLALERWPDPRYLRWLSERVTVEKPLIGYVATQALVAAALLLPRKELEHLRTAVVEAQVRLGEMIETEEKPDPETDIPSRQRVLQDTATLLEMRARPGRSALTPDHLDRFLDGLVREFDFKQFDVLFYGEFGSSLSILAKDTDPVEYAVLAVILWVRKKKWESRLVRAAFKARDKNPTFIELQGKYAIAAL